MFLSMKNQCRNLFHISDKNENDISWLLNIDECLSEDEKLMFIEGKKHLKIWLECVSRYYK